ncbi:MAG: hypothetical protein OXE99_14610 [Cellvibrionales bacterium]|nr:hypothetical protein [Cellvibrionales bacterium]
MFLVNHSDFFTLLPIAGRQLLRLGFCLSICIALIATSVTEEHCEKQWLKQAKSLLSQKPETQDFDIATEIYANDRNLLCMIRPKFNSNILHLLVGEGKVDYLTAIFKKSPNSVMQTALDQKNRSGHTPQQWIFGRNKNAGKLHSPALDKKVVETLKTLFEEKHKALNLSFMTQQEYDKCVSLEMVYGGDWRYCIEGFTPPET